MKNRAAKSNETKWTVKKTNEFLLRSCTSTCEWQISSLYVICD